jgi:hypothetical protein
LIFFFISVGEFTDNADRREERDMRYICGGPEGREKGGKVE